MQLAETDAPARHRERLRGARARPAGSPRQGRSIINLGIGQPDFPTPENIVAAAQKALADGHHGYTPANGILPLREAVAEDILKWRGVEVDPDRIVIVPGGKVTMYFAITMFGEPGTEIMYPDPGFPIYRSVIEFTGAKAVPIPLYEDSGFSFSAEEVLAKITPRTRLIIVNSPANPTGGVVPRDELDKLVAGLAEHPQVVVMSDEIYARMVYDNVPHASMLVYPELADRLILLDGWSKTYAMTGWRLGYAVWPQGPRRARDAACDQHPLAASTPRPSGPGIEALKGPQDAVDRMVARVRRAPQGDPRAAERACRASAACARAAPSTPSPTSPAPATAARQLQDDLLDEVGVALVAGTSFGDQGEGYIRFSYANSIANIEEAIDRIARFLGR